MLQTAPAGIINSAQIIFFQGLQAEVGSARDATAENTSMGLRGAQLVFHEICKSFLSQSAECVLQFYS